jgi:cytochrome P450
MTTRRRGGAGDLLTINLPAANRDLAILDQPDTFSFDRNVRGHLAFGHGVDQCLGQSPARAELQVAHDMSAYGVHELPVTW